MTPGDGVSTGAQQNRQYDVAPDGRFLSRSGENAAQPAPDLRCGVIEN
jgi:hypothetical protein